MNDTLVPIEKQCGEADCGPKQWGHRCVNRKGHGRKIEHRCDCGHSWSQPVDDDIESVRTVLNSPTL
jgi:hypothetical protein